MGGGSGNGVSGHFGNTKGNALDILSAALPAAGLIPAIGMPADLAAAVVDALRGDYFDAGLSLLSAVPFVGEVAGVSKVAKVADTIHDIDKANDVLKTVDKISDSKKFSKKEEKLIKELQKSKIKFNKESLKFITKDKTGQTIWLEKGSKLAGLDHITSRHAKDFEKAFGISKAQLPTYLNNVVTKGRVVKNTTKQIGNRIGYERIYYYKGKHFVVTGIGSNGFIVSAYPKSIK